MNCIFNMFSVSYTQELTHKGTDASSLSNYGEYELDPNRSKYIINYAG